MEASFTSGGSQGSGVEVGAAGGGEGLDMLDQIFAGVGRADGEKKCFGVAGKVEQAIGRPGFSDGRIAGDDLEPGEGAGGPGGAE